MSRNSLVYYTFPYYLGDFEYIEYGMIRRRQAQVGADRLR